MMTEKEAREKWCAFARVIAANSDGPYFTAVPGVYAHNRVQEQGHKNEEATWNAAHECVGRKCMSWRWFDGLSDDGSGCHMTPTKHVIRHPDNNPAETRPLSDRRGYCGLAGKP